MSDIYTISNSSTTSSLDLDFGVLNSHQNSEDVRAAESRPARAYAVRSPNVAIAALAAGAALFSPTGASAVSVRSYFGAESSASVRDIAELGLSEVSTFVRSSLSWVDAARVAWEGFADMEARREALALREAEFYAGYYDED